MDSEQASQWGWEEFWDVASGDVRRTRRVVGIAQRLAKKPAGIVSRVFENGAERQGAYDLLESGHVTAEALCASMAAACVERSRGQSRVFVPIDGTSIQVVDRDKATDLGSVGTYTSQGRGVQVVTALAVTMGGVPLGLCAQQFWTRPTARPNRRRTPYRPLQQRETRFTVTAIAQVAAQYDGTGCKPWLVLDRAGDATEVIHELMNSNVCFTVRASWDRRLKNSRLYLRDYVRNQRVLCTYKLNVPGAFNRAPRVATMVLRVARVTLDFLHDWKAKRPHPTLTVVWITERNVPRGQKPLDWLLYTNVSVESAEDARLVLKSYVTRWRIEEFHKTWKTGACSVESMQLRSAAAVTTWATLLAAVAARIERLKYLARNEAEQPASVELKPIEIEALILLKRENKKRTETITDDIPPIGLAVLWMAELGGYAGKKSDRPGSITIKRGLDKVRHAAKVISILRKTGQMR
jgi:hypothetical protein